MRYFLFVLLAGLAIACNSQGMPDSVPDSWEQIEKAAEGEIVNMMMWKGDPLINRYMETVVVPSLKKDYNITLNLISGQGSVIVTTLMKELEANRNQSEIDLAWINGETFFQLRQISALYGPFTDKLPNNRYIDWSNPFINTDFQQAVDGFECPWGNVQMAWIYNSEKVPSPPTNLTSLEKWLEENPGKFTISNDFTGMTLLKTWLISLAGGGKALNGPFDREKYDQYSTQLWEFINKNKQYFWNEGRTFPATLGQMHQLFATGEIWFTMSNNDAEVENKMLQGFFPESSRAFVPDYGSIQNSHYLGIPRNAPNKAAALVVCNYLISPEAQFIKFQSETWGDGTILDVALLPSEWREKFTEAGKRQFGPSRSAISDKALMEPDPEYMLALFEDFRKKVM